MKHFLWCCLFVFSLLSLSPASLWANNSQDFQDLPCIRYYTKVELSQFENLQVGDVITVEVLDKKYLVEISEIRNRKAYAEPVDSSLNCGVEIFPDNYSALRDLLNSLSRSCLRYIALISKAQFENLQVADVITVEVFNKTHKVIVSKIEDGKAFAEVIDATLDCGVEIWINPREFTEL